MSKQITIRGSVDDDEVGFATKLYYKFIDKLIQKSKTNAPMDKIIYEIAETDAASNDFVMKHSAVCNMMACGMFHPEIFKKYEIKKKYKIKHGKVSFKDWLEIQLHYVRKLLNFNKFQPNEVDNYCKQFEESYSSAANACDDSYEKMTTNANTIQKEYKNFLKDDMLSKIGEILLEYKNKLENDESNEEKDCIDIDEELLKII